MPISLQFLIYRVKRRYLSLLIWSAFWLFFGLVFSSLFNSLSKDAISFQTLIESMPKSITASFNITADYLTKVEKFISGQFLTIYTLGGTVFALFIGVNEVGGKIEDGTWVQFHTKNISRIQLYLLQNLSNIIFLGLSSILVWLGLFLEFKLLATSQSDISLQYFTVSALATFCLFVCATSFGQLLGIIVSKIQAQAFGSSVLVFMWFLNSLSTTSGYPEWLKPVSLYFYINVPRLRDQFSLDFPKILVLILLSITFTIAGSLFFRQKDLQL